MSSPHPAPNGSADALSELRADLAAADYTVDRVREVLGPLVADALHREQALPADLATRGSSDPVAVLIRLFVLGMPVQAWALAAAMPRTGADGLVALGLVAAEPAAEAGLCATCDLRPHGDERHTWWIVSDRTELAGAGPLPTDHVLGAGGASVTLASWTPRPWARRALDLGTGCGVQALHLAEHTAYRIVTDISERALAFTAFTAALNEVDLEPRRGFLLEPVAGEQFDLIVSNPPFVITPRTPGVPVYDYRDGGATGDDLVAGLVGQIGAHLRPGGIAQLLGNWELIPGEDWRDRVAGWLERTEVDAWVIQRAEQDVAEYAETWARDAGHRPGSEGYEHWYAAWLTDFAGRGIERVGFGIVTLQRPAEIRPTWRTLEDVRTPVAAPLGPTVLAGLRARSWLAMHTDEEVLSVPWTVAEDVTEERVGRPGATDPTVIQLRQGGGLGRVVRLDTLSAGLVGACDGELTAAQIVHALAALTETDVEEVRATVTSPLRALVADGLLH